MKFFLNQLSWFKQGIAENDQAQSTEIHLADMDGNYFSLYYLEIKLFKSLESPEKIIKLIINIFL